MFGQVQKSSAKHQQQHLHKGENSHFLLGDSNFSNFGWRFFSVFDFF